MQQLRRSPLRSFAAPIITSRCLDTGMSCQLLSRGNIRTSVEQVADETAAKIVRRKVRYASFGGASKENVENGLIRYAVHCDSASTFINSAKERTGITTTG